jgi:hypothetical protein
MKSDLLDPFMKTSRGSGPSPSGDISARVLGRVAAGALRSNSSWEVAAVFRRSFYCRSRAGSFVCFGPMSLGSGPLNVLYQMSEPIDWEAARLMTGSLAACDGTFFHITERFVFLLSEAKIWRPANPFAAWHAATILEGLAILGREVCSRPVRGGLQVLIPMLTGIAPNPSEGARAADPLIRMAMEGIEPLAAWLETRLACPSEPMPVPIPAIDALIGLGPGLTPSGDDFLGGVLVALHHLGASDVVGYLAEKVLSRAERRTNEISYAHLAAAAEGEGLAPLHAVLSSLCAPRAPRLGQSLSGVDAIGHSSGWDAMAGVALAAAITARVRAVRVEMRVAV